jgi:hypothetical protein
MKIKNSPHRAVRGRHSGIGRTFGDGKGRMTDREWREAWKREMEPFVVPCAVSFLLGGIVMAALIGGTL